MKAILEEKNNYLINISVVFPLILKIIVKKHKIKKKMTVYFDF